LTIEALSAVGDLVILRSRKRNRALSPAVSFVAKSQRSRGPSSLLKYSTGCDITWM
jgi:hypothetical protein